MFRYEDSCGVYWPFEPERNVPVDCNSDESHTPGTFCVKIVKQGPRGFICKFGKKCLMMENNFISLIWI